MQQLIPSNELLEIRTRRLQRSEVSSFGEGADKLQYLEGEDFQCPRIDGGAHIDVLR